MAIESLITRAIGISMVGVIAACAAPTVGVAGPSQNVFDPTKVGTNRTVTGAKDVAGQWVRLVGENKADEACQLLAHDADATFSDPGNGNPCASHMAQKVNTADLRKLWLTSKLPPFIWDENSKSYSVYRADMLDGHGQRWSQDESVGSFAYIEIKWVEGISRWQITRLSLQR